MSPLLPNIALSVLDEHLHGPWKPDGAMSTEYRRARRRAQQLPTWRMVRYADDFVVDGAWHPAVGVSRPHVSVSVRPHVSVSAR